MWEGDSVGFTFSELIEFLFSDWWANVKEKQEAKQKINQALWDGTIDPIWAAERLGLIERKKQKPGPIPMADEDKMLLVIDFISSGLTQEVYRGLRSISKHELESSLRWARENPDYFQGFPGIDSATLETIRKRLRRRR
ncbi:MAG: hypothetical protein DCC55_27955 [Chloroflexi bacterium]|nr:MAG: hypothetical protein DCC55_27955 [Chloroflexota bacterium]